MGTSYSSVKVNAKTCTKAAVQAGTDWLRKGEVLLDNKLDVNQTCALVVKETNHILGCISK